MVETSDMKTKGLALSRFGDFPLRLRYSIGDGNGRGRKDS